MDKYGEHRWWLSDDAKERAYYQMHEPRLLLPSFGQFCDDIVTLIGRPVWTHEFLSDKLTAQVDAAWATQQLREQQAEASGE